VITYEMEDKLE